MIIAIDPGNVDSAFVVVDEKTYKLISFGKYTNEIVRSMLAAYAPDSRKTVIEMVASYGMPVGKEVFDTCVWIGRFTECAVRCGSPVTYIPRLDEKMHLCHDSRASDANIRRALIDRFAEHDLKNGKGTKKNPDYFHGFSRDIWAAFAVAVTYIDRMKEG